LRAYHWPGNVRELSNLIERLAVLHPGATVAVADLPQRYRVKAAEDVAATAVVAEMRREGSTGSIAGISTRSSYAEPPMLIEATHPSSELPPEGVNLKDHIENIELSLIRQALQQAGGVVAHAAKLLNTRRTTLVEKLRKYGLSREDCEGDVMHG
ncbi:MAG: helix-turn-helix domain-containing protein, partial [Gammaproteobacteria bacterium]